MATDEFSLFEDVALHYSLRSQSATALVPGPLQVNFAGICAFGANAELVSSSKGYFCRKRCTLRDRVSAV